MPIWNKFWNWYSRQLKENLLFLLIINVIQIPHMIWIADEYFKLDIPIARVHPILDFLLYGIDLIEILALIQIIMLIYAHGLRKKGNRN